MNWRFSGLTISSWKKNPISSVELNQANGPGSRFSNRKQGSFQITRPDRYDWNTVEMAVKPQVTYQPIYRTGWLVILGLTALLNSPSVYVEPSLRDR